MPQNWSRPKPYYWSTITAIKALFLRRKHPALKAATYVSFLARAIPRESLLWDLWALKSFKKCGKSFPATWFSCSFLGNPKGGLAKGGLARKAPIGPKRALSGQLLLFPRGCGLRRNWSPIGPEKAPIGPEKVPICPEKARFRREGFPPDFLWKFGA